MGRIIQENKFTKGGEIDAKNYRIQELNVVRYLSWVKLEDKEKTAESKNRQCKVRKLWNKISQINNYYRLKYWNGKNHNQSNDPDHRKAKPDH